MTDETMIDEILRTKMGDVIEQAKRAAKNRIDAALRVDEVVR